jgi:hypothetical protein
VVELFAGVKVLRALVAARAHGTTRSAFLLAHSTSNTSHMHAGQVQDRSRVVGALLRPSTAFSRLFAAQAPVVRLLGGATCSRCAPA